MPSAESAAIRATFTKHADAPPVPPVIARREWEAAAPIALPPTFTVTPVDVAGLRGAWISSAGAAPDAACLFAHGGGYNAGSCVTHQELAAHVCLASGVRVLLFDYRLAPEYPFPAAVEDAAAAYRWLLTQQVQPSRIVIVGDSAGGGLAVATLLWLRDHGTALPAAGVLLSPWLDLTLSGPTMETHAGIDPVVSKQALQQAVTWYIGNNDSSQPLASPLHGALDDLPPFLVQVGSDEVLLSDATRFAEQARASGVDVTLEEWDGMWHVWHGFAGTLPEAQQAIEQIGAFIQQQFAHP